jgi:transcriptional regulator with XRE-family HTH domain
MTRFPFSHEAKAPASWALAPVPDAGASIGAHAAPSTTREVVFAITLGGASFRPYAARMPRPRPRGSPNHAPPSAARPLPVSASFGEHLRSWRTRRHLTQMQLALRANVSARHLGFVETGRAAPSRALVLRLSEELDVPLRQRNTWLMAAGFAPVYGDRSMDDASFEAVRFAIDVTLEAHKPFPAFAIDRHWNVVVSNRALPELYVGVDPQLLEPPVNVLRLSLHPAGLAPRILNLREWSEHLLGRLRRELELTADPRLESLHEEALAYRAPASDAIEATDPPAVAIPLRIDTQLGVLSFLSTVSVFGTALDVTLSELALELFYPADKPTSERVRAAESSPR